MMRLLSLLLLISFFVGVSCSKKDATDVVKAPGKGDLPLTPEEKEKLEKLAGLSPANLGFTLVESATIPYLRETEKSVFRIFNPAGEKISLTSLMNKMGVSSTDAVVNTLKEKQAPTEEDRVNVDLVILQIQRCQKLVIRDEECMVLVDMSKGTAFISGDGTELWTALHNVRDELANLKSAEFQLYNSKMELVFDSFKEPVQIQTPDENFVKEGVKGESVKCTRFLTDWLHVKLPRSLGKGLTISNKRLDGKEGFFIVGFPKETNDRKAYNTLAGDSDGKSLYYTSGKVRAEEAKLLMGNCEKMGDSVNDVILLDSDSYKKMSGGPILNERGEVVGVYNYSFPANGKANSYSTSFGTGFSQILK